MSWYRLVYTWNHLREYVNLGVKTKTFSGKKVSLKNRIIDHKELHPKTKRHNTLFYAASSLDWQELIHEERGMQSVNFSFKSIEAPGW